MNEIIDTNVEQVRQALLQRSQVGIKKYGVTTDRDDLALVDWLQHALEETLDKAVYLQAAISKIKQAERSGQIDGQLAKTDRILF